MKKIPGIYFLVFLFGSLSLLSGCFSGKPVKKTSKRPKEYFSESEYGVRASPRMASKGQRLPLRVGRYHVGKPYKIRGKWYYPEQNVGYKKIGFASWYGSAFHGRLTANGEVFDMRKLTAAHPTMPLPSYVRVTNLKNRTSVIVRVNDRGPYARNHIIDLSHRAAQVLDYAHKGVTPVMVQYLSRAPLHGKDERYLLASWTPGNANGSAYKPLSAPGSVLTAMAAPHASGSGTVTTSTAHKEGIKGFNAQLNARFIGTHSDPEKSLDPENLNVKAIIEKSPDSQLPQAKLPDSVDIALIIEDDFDKRTLDFLSSRDPRAQVKQMSSHEVISSWKKSRDRSVKNISLPRVFSQPKESSREG